MILQVSNSGFSDPHLCPCPGSYFIYDRWFIEFLTLEEFAEFIRVNHPLLILPAQLCDSRIHIRLLETKSRNLITDREETERLIDETKQTIVQRKSIPYK